MGPTWIFPHQYKIQALVKELGLKLFEQYAAGDVLFQAQNAAQPRQIAGAGAGAMQLFRLSGGMYQLVNSISKELDNPESQCQIKLDHCVIKFRVFRGLIDILLSGAKRINCPIFNITICHVIGIFTIEERKLI